MNLRVKPVAVFLTILLIILTSIAVFLLMRKADTELEAFASEEGIYLFTVEEYGKNKHRILKIDLDSDKVLWKAGIPMEYTLNHSSDYPSLFFDEDHVYYYINEGFLLTENSGDTVQSKMAFNYALSAFNKETGEAVFSLRVPDRERSLETNRSVPYINLNDTIVLLNPILGEKQTMFTLVNKTTGAVVAQKPLPCSEVLARPLGTTSTTSKYFSLWSPGLAYIFRKDEITDFRELRTGNSFSYQNDEYFYYFNRSNELVRHTLKSGKEDALWVFDGILPQDMYKYGNSLVAYEKDLRTEIDTDSIVPIRRFVSYDFNRGIRNWTYHLPEGYGFNIFANRQRNIQPEAAVYYDILSPTLPLVVSPEQDDEEKSRIIVINCESGLPVQESNPLIQSALLPSSVLRSSSFYLVVMDKHLLKIDRSSGKRDKFMKIIRDRGDGPEELYLSANIQAKYIVGDKLLIPRGNQVLIVDLDQETIDTAGEGDETFYLELSESTN